MPLPSLSKSYASLSRSGPSAAAPSSSTSSSSSPSPSCPGSGSGTSASTKAAPTLRSSQLKSYLANKRHQHTNNVTSSKQLKPKSKPIVLKPAPPSLASTRVANPTAKAAVLDQKLKLIQSLSAPVKRPRAALDAGASSAASAPTPAADRPSKSRKVISHSSHHQIGGRKSTPQSAAPRIRRENGNIPLDPLPAAARHGRARSLAAHPAPPPTSATIKRVTSRLDGSNTAVKRSPTPSIADDTVAAHATSPPKLRPSADDPPMDQRQHVPSTASAASADHRAVNSPNPSPEPPQRDLGHELAALRTQLAGERALRTATARDLLLLQAGVELMHTESAAKLTDLHGQLADSTATITQLESQLADMHAALNKTNKQWRDVLFDELAKLEREAHCGVQVAVARAAAAKQEAGVWKRRAEAAEGMVRWYEKVMGGLDKDSRPREGEQAGKTMKRRETWGPSNWGMRQASETADSSGKQVQVALEEKDKENTRQEQMPLAEQVAAIDVQVKKSRRTVA